MEYILPSKYTECAHSSINTISFTREDIQKDSLCYFAKEFQWYLQNQERHAQSSSELKTHVQLLMTYRMFSSSC